MSVTKRAVPRYSCRSTWTSEVRECLIPDFDGAIFTDKAPAYAKVIWEINPRREARDEILHCDQKWWNSRIESDHAALKRTTDPRQRVQSLRTVKATLHGVEAIRTIKRAQNK